MFREVCDVCLRESHEVFEGKARKKTSAQIRYEPYDEP